MDRYTLGEEVIGIRFKYGLFQSIELRFVSPTSALFNPGEIKPAIIETMVILKVIDTIQVFDSTDSSSHRGFVLKGDFHSLFNQYETYVSPLYHHTGDSLDYRLLPHKTTRYGHEYQDVADVIRSILHYLRGNLLSEHGRKYLIETYTGILSELIFGIGYVPVVKGTLDNGLADVKIIKLDQQPSYATLEHCHDFYKYPHTYNKD